MYNYLMNVTAANKKTAFSPVIIDAIKKACEDANNSPNSLRFGRHFTYEGKIDNQTVQIRLESEDTVTATRTISSISRALIKLCPEGTLESLKYNKTLLNATVINEYKQGIEAFDNLKPYEIVQSVIEIFFGQTPLRYKDKQAAKKAANAIKNIVSIYKGSVHK